MSVQIQVKLNGHKAKNNKQKNRKTHRTHRPKQMSYQSESIQISAISLHYCLQKSKGLSLQISRYSNLKKVEMLLTD